MPDKTLVCVDCGAEFVFTEGEQEFYSTKGFDQEPKRCPDCRRNRKRQQMRQYNQGYGIVWTLSFLMILLRD